MSLVTTDTSKPYSRTSGRYTISSYCRNLERHDQPLHTHGTHQHIPLDPTSLAPDFLSTLPLEIIYKILSHMWPEGYVALACTSRLALQLTNNYVRVELPCLIKYTADPEVQCKYFAKHFTLAGACRSMRADERRYEWEEHPCFLMPLSDDEQDL